jgi:hypothetical protein
MASDDPFIQRRREDMGRREQERAARKADDEKAAQLRRFLAQGGQTAIRAKTNGEVFSRLIGGKRERETARGEVTAVSTLLSPKLKLTPYQRAVGQCYGAYAETVTIAGSSEFLREHVDGGSAGAGGVTERQIEMLRMVSSARKAVQRLAAFKYPVGPARGDKRVGRHAPIPAIEIMDSVCIFAWTLTALAVSHEWIVERNGQMVVPDRQRKALAANLAEVLDAVADAWDARGFRVPAHFGQIEVD